MRILILLFTSENMKFGWIRHLEEHLLRNLDRNGVVRLGYWVETSDILVGKLTPQIASESSYIAKAGLLRSIFGLEVSTSKETSVKLPIGVLTVLNAHI